MLAGLRKQELSHVTRDGVTFNGEVFDLHVPNGTKCPCPDCAKTGGVFYTKGKRERFAPLTKPAEQIVRRQLARREREATPGGCSRYSGIGQRREAALAPLCTGNTCRR